VKQQQPADQAESFRAWLTEPERAALRAAELADIESGLHPERYAGWRYWTAECVEQGLRALCGSEVQP
jgi:hypothetical protein